MNGKSTFVFVGTAKQPSPIGGLPDPMSDSIKGGK
jgi:hypothetical protein